MTIELGIILPEKKRKKILLPERIEKLCAESDINVTLLDVDKPDFFEQGPFHVLLHKVSDFANECSVCEASAKIAKVKRFAAMHSSMVVLDDFESADNVSDRKQMTSLLQSCEMTLPAVRVFVPKIVEIAAGTSMDDIRAIIKREQVCFPILAKPLSARLEKGSHDMVLIFNEQQLCDIPLPCLVQEFINHSGVMYKVYVVGERISLCERPSIRDISSTGDTEKASIWFDTRDISKTGKAFIPSLHAYDPNKRRWMSCDERSDMLNMAVVERIVERLRANLNLHLFGLDVLIESETGNYALVDCNQFPGYTGINQQHFVKYLVELVIKLANND